MDISFEMTIDGALESEPLCEKLGLAPGGRVQAAIDRSCIEWFTMYCPWRTGALARSPYTASTIGSGVITYDVSYAKKMYYGEEDGVPVGHYSTAINALAGPFWAERAKADHLADIVAAGRDALEGK